MPGPGRPVKTDSPKEEELRQHPLALAQAQLELELLLVEWSERKYQRWLARLEWHRQRKESTFDRPKRDKKVGSVLSLRFADCRWDCIFNMHASIIAYSTTTKYSTVLARNVESTWRLLVVHVNLQLVTHHDCVVNSHLGLPAEIEDEGFSLPWFLFGVYRPSVVFDSCLGPWLLWVDLLMFATSSIFQPMITDFDIEMRTPSLKLLWLDFSFSTAPSARHLYGFSSHSLPYNCTVFSASVFSNSIRMGRPTLQCEVSANSTWDGGC